MDERTSTQSWPPAGDGRERAILRAVAAGQGELADGVDLYLDGRHCCDQSAAYRLIRTGCIEPAAPGRGRFRAVITAAGWALMRPGADQRAA